MWHCLLLLQHLIDISFLLGQQQQTHCMLLQWVNGSDGQTPYRFIEPAPHAGSAKYLNKMVGPSHVTVINSVAFRLQ